MRSHLAVGEYNMLHSLAEYIILSFKVIGRSKPLVLWYTVGKTTMKIYPFPSGMANDHLRHCFVRNTVTKMNQTLFTGRVTQTSRPSCRKWDSTNPTANWSSITNNSKYFIPETIQ